MFQTSTNPRRRISPGRKGAHLPKGECQFILLHPELQGQRCACVGFSLNDSTPGSTCECGHQSCYHLDQKEGTADRDELELLKEKVRLLEEEFGREKQNGGSDLVCKVSQVEDILERHKTAVESEIKGVYRDVGGLWQDIRNMQGGMQKWAKHYEDHIEALIDANHSCNSDIANIEKRLIDMDDTSMKMEERIENLETYSPEDIFCKRKASASPEVERNSHEPAENHTLGQEEEQIQEEGNGHSEDLGDEQHLDLAREQSQEELPNDTQMCDDTSKSWTVHVSLLPKADTPMPFEKDTNAYKRCLSRGLHKMLAIPGHDSESFNRAISDAFHVFLLGRPWMPLDAKLCDAPINDGALMGLPMLRSLPKHEIEVGRYTYQWLSQRCATKAPNGKIADLYIAMIDESLTWSEIGNAPVFINGLEGCWYFDKVLDRKLGEDSTSDDEASAGDILPNIVRKKRPSSSLLSQPSFGSIEGEIFAKRARLNVAESVDRLRPMTKAV